MTTLTFQPLGDQAVRVGFADGQPREVALSDATGDRVAAFVEAVRRRTPAGFTDIVAAYATVGVYYDPLVTSYPQLVRDLSALVTGLPAQAGLDGRVVTIPVRFGGEDGIDFDECVGRLGLSATDFIARFTEPIYTVRMVGFLPGFPYLTGLPDSLALPRRSVPRTRVTAGSVGIAGAQAGIYPFDSPAGWNIIGRTSVALFDIERDPAALLKAGDRVRFAAL